MSPSPLPIVVRGKRGWLQWTAERPNEVVAIIPDTDFDLKRELRALRPLRIDTEVIEGKRRSLLRFPFGRYRRVGFYVLGVSPDLLKTLRDAADDAGVR